MFGPIIITANMSGSARFAPGKPGSDSPLKTAHPAAREARIQALGRQLLSSVPRDMTRLMHLQNFLLRQSMHNPQLARHLFELVGRYPQIKRPRDLRSARRELFTGQGIPAPILLKIGLNWAFPATLFYPVYMATVDMMAQRFIAGDNLPLAKTNILRLFGEGMGVTIDKLGESADKTADPQATAAANLECYEEDMRYFALLAREQGQQANFSFKLTGVNAEVSRMQIENIRKSFRRLLGSAMDYGAFLRLDMEFFSIEEMTLNEVFIPVLSEDRFAGYRDVGIVQQVYLKKADQEADEIIAFARQRGVSFSVRLVKGAYYDTEVEKAQAEGYEIPVWQHKAESDLAYERIAEKYLRAMKKDNCIRPVFATHNPRTIAAVLALAEEIGIPFDQLEFQFLYGMEFPLAYALLALGCRVRIYTPQGNKIEGLPYYVRRLKENAVNSSMLMLTLNYLAGKVSVEELLLPPLAASSPPLPKVL